MAKRMEALAVDGRDVLFLVWLVIRAAVSSP